MRARPTLCRPVGKHEHPILLDFCRSLFSVCGRYSQKALVIFFFFFFSPPLAKVVSHSFSSARGVSHFLPFADDVSH